MRVEALKGKFYGWTESRDEKKKRKNGGFEPLAMTSQEYLKLEEMEGEDRRVVVRAKRMPKIRQDLSFFLSDPL